MFGLFGKKKALEQIAANIATMINISFWSLRKDNDGDLPEEMPNDRFVLGYIYGVTGGGIHIAGLSKPKDKGSVLVAVYDLLFPGKGREISLKCNGWSNNKDEVFLRAMKIAVEESSTVYKAMLSGDEKAAARSVGAFRTFNNHIHTNYLHDNDAGKNNDDAIQRICKVADAFMIASLLLVDKDELKNKPEKRWKVMAFQFGGIDYLGQASNLDQTETLAGTVILLMKYYQMGPDEAGDTARQMMGLSQNPEGLAYMIEGGNSIKRWLEGDKNAPLKLFDLLKEK